eukprot:6360800-Amphidinium_carterae.1
MEEALQLALHDFQDSEVSSDPGARSPWSESEAGSTAAARHRWTRWRTQRPLEPPLGLQPPWSRPWRENPRESHDRLHDADEGVIVGRVLAALSQPGRLRATSQGRCDAA